MGGNRSITAEPQMPEVRENINIIQAPHISATFWRSLLRTAIKSYLKGQGQFFHPH